MGFLFFFWFFLICVFVLISNLIYTFWMIHWLVFFSFESFYWVQKEERKKLEIKREWRVNPRFRWVLKAQEFLNLVMTICLWWKLVLGITGMSQFSNFNWNLSLLVLVNFLIQNLGFFLCLSLGAHIIRGDARSEHLVAMRFSIADIAIMKLRYIHININPFLSFFLGV